MYWANLCVTEYFQQHFGHLELFVMPEWAGVEWRGGELEPRISISKMDYSIGTQSKP
jgi:hypothetical protein